MTVPAALINRLATAERVAVLTGAGVSAESGVPTFRDAQTGLWADFKAEGPGHATRLPAQSTTGLGMV